MTESNREQPARRTWYQNRLMWLLAGLGLLMGVLDTLLLANLGFEMSLHGRDGTYVLGFTLALTFALAGAVIGLMKQAQRRERHFTHIQRQQAAQMAEMQSRMAQSEKMAALGQMAATIAHEVRNPLAIIGTHVQNLGESAESLDPQMSRVCSVILGEIGRLSRVIDTLVRFVRPLAVEKKAVALEDLVQRVQFLTAPLLRQKQMRLKIEAPPRLPRDFQGDPDLICQVLMGLIENAINMSTAESALVLRIRPDAEAVIFAVEDQGPGVPEALQERIFLPFFSTQPSGCGLGLAVAGQIAKAHGGTLSLGANSPMGACFNLKLPMR